MKPTHISWGHHIVAEVAAKLISRDVGEERGAQEVGGHPQVTGTHVPSPLLLWSLQAMPHDYKRVEAQGSVDDQLWGARNKNSISRRRTPSRG